MNEETSEGAAASVGYFLDLYRYAFMTSNTTEISSIAKTAAFSANQSLTEQINYTKMAAGPTSGSKTSQTSGTTTNLKGMITVESKRL